MSRMDDLAHQAAALDEVSDELDRQFRKWGEQNHPDGTGERAMPLNSISMVSESALSSIRAPHLAKVATRVTDMHAQVQRATWADILLEEVFEALAEDDPTKLTAELIQTAAVCIQWAVAIERRTDG